MMMMQVDEVVVGGKTGIITTTIVFPLSKGEIRLRIVKRKLGFLCYLMVIHHTTSCVCSFCPSKSE